MQFRGFGNQGFFFFGVIYNEWFRAFPDDGFSSLEVEKWGKIVGGEGEGEGSIHR